jgi:flagellar hook-associated protein 1 FlgK
MGLTSALGTVLSGLQSAQNGLQLVAANVANANTPGYTRKEAQLAPILAGGTVTGVRVTDVTRTIDSYVQTQLRVESGGLSYAQTNSTYLTRLVQLFGTPGDGNSLDTLVGNLDNALDQLATSPDSTVAQSQVLTGAQTLAQSLNTLSAGVQSLRAQANGDLSSATDQVNAILGSLSDLQTKIAATGASGTSTANLLDQQDTAIDQLSGLLDIKVSGGSGGAPLSITTNSGIPLFQNGNAAKLIFTGSSNVGAGSQYNSDPSKSTLGTITITDAAGATSDLLAPSGVQSGSIRALADLRDSTLVEAQNQLDGLAAGVASALGSTTVSDTDGSDGYTADLSRLQAGNTLTVNYVDGSGAPQSMTFVRVNSAASLPIAAGAVPGKSPVVGIDFSGGLTSAVAQMQSALGGNFDLTLAGSTLTVAADPAGTATMGGLASVVSATATQGQGTALPFFVDAGGAPYTGSLDGLGQRLGFASRIAVNPALTANPSLLVKSTPSTSSGDPTRPLALRDALEDAGRAWDADTGIGTAANPFTGSATAFAAQILNKQGGAAQNASNVATGQQVVVNTLQDSMNQTSGVNIDDEMEKLIQLQTTYSANARVVTTISQMLQSLMTMGT